MSSPDLLPEAQTLGAGRPPLPPEAVLPGRTTLLENLNAVSAGHLQRIVGLMCRDQESRLPGSFGILIVDSTPVRADMALVTDTHLVWSSADRLCGLLGRAAADGLQAPALSAEACGWLDGLARGARTVALSGGPARRHQETVHGMLGDACRLALAACEPEGAGGRPGAGARGAGAVRQAGAGALA